MNDISVFTIGYEDSTIDEFITRLQKHNIAVLVDVREVPASRKPGFSKNRLSEILHDHNIGYLHVKALGSPKAIREKLHRDNDYESFFDGYNAYIDSQLDVVKELYDEVVSRETSCLMCMERFPEHCHRRVVADKIKEIDGNGLKIRHI
ncbi:MAG: DUF488 domain-containing protein [Nitrospiraceae bacterium]|nr:DUF488 domain-containing protein [Nitrospiraceae bacterium]